MSLSAALVLALGAAAAPSARPSPVPSCARDVLVSAPGRVALRLDRQIYEEARADLADLRVRDDEGRLVPFVLDRGLVQMRRADLRPAIRNRVTRTDGAVSAVLDFGGRAPGTRLRLELSGDNFRRRVSVEGSASGEAWATLVDEAWVFAVPARGADGGSARYETVTLPENDFPLLRVVVHPGEFEQRPHRLELPGEFERSPQGPHRRAPWESPHLLGAVAPRSVAAVREEVLRPNWTRAEVPEARETWLTLDLGSRHQPFHAIEVEVDDERFFREVVVEARRAPASGGEALRWDPVATGEIHRLEHAGRRRECRRLDVAGRERVLRLRLRNGDDRPLAIRGVSLLVPAERVAFEAAAGREYRLEYGSPEAHAPSFDLVRTLEDPTAWADEASAVDLGPVQRRARPADRIPWTERHPALLWVTLIAVVAALGGLTFRALRSRPPADDSGRDVPESRP